MSLGEYTGKGASITKLLLHFNGNANDSSGNGATNGTSTSITYSNANGKFGQGAGFNSALNSQITFSSYIIPLGVKTVSFWFKTTQNTFARVLSNLTENSNGTGMQFIIDQPAGVKFQLSAYKSNVLQYQALTTSSINDGKWNNIIMTWTGNNAPDGVKLYFNGTLEAVATSNAIDGTPSGVLRLGRYSTTYDYTGALDEIIVENVVWSPQEVKKYYTNSKGYFSIL